MVLDRVMSTGWMLHSGHLLLRIPSTNKNHENGRMKESWAVSELRMRKLQEGYTVKVDTEKGPVEATPTQIGRFQLHTGKGFIMMRQSN